jgi:tetratricopeptide (TPR) repeat protein
LTPIEEARALVAKGAADAAIQKLSEFLNDDFYNDEALFMLGACLQAKGMNGLSAVITSAAIDARTAQKRSFPEALMNLGAAYKAEHKNETAMRVWADALRQESLPRERAKILTNIAGLYVNERDPLKAIEYCDRALNEDPRNAGAKANRGLACLELGRWREGWLGYQATYEAGDRTRRNYPGIPEWDGTLGKHVIVFGDQGIGDEIYFASCLTDMQRACRKVTLDCHPRLPGLFSRSFTGIEIHGTRKHLSELEWLHDSDAEAAIGISDLPRFFRNADDEWRGEPYLKAADGHYLDGTGTAERSVLRNSAKSPLRIGLSWTGGSKKTRTELRSLDISALEPILRARPEARWFSLQYTPNAAREVCELEERAGIRISHYPGWVECHDYDRTASFVASLDLVITVTTAVHDLASALGVPNWVLVPYRTSWRFQPLGDERLPWYDAARLFRQKRDGVWDDPIQEIAGRLADFTRIS